ncbi:hypothetical protein NONI108955_20905 [Nocardia ninae]|uniref:Uncharacterized protein n=1 Tax=Nocardia ninae NBRC 108245 TaxID=1210091 RepID=A0A511M9S2_9NOCA|nr:hypothetical protein [Nocardia ninae]GEM37412.1 hypothetical protein NN4_19310 [Nocardia ninae NBRC 108245]
MNEIQSSPDDELVAARAAVFAYDCSPAVCAFEAIAFGKWWVQFGRRERSGMDPGGAYYDKRFLAMRREEGKKTSGAAYVEILAARQMLADATVAG